MATDTLIRVLPDHVANQIAAGEVVERPASVLKELLENALDAGATQCDAAAAAGGRTLVALEDNGAGMSRDDALLSIERHATSKIRGVDDLDRIATLGFRGEALAAIASVARFRLRTRRAADRVGTELVVAGGKLQDVREAGGPPGTAVEVRALFFNVPARRKFLRSEATELAHLRQVFVTQALAHPAVGLSLTIDGRPAYRLPAGAALEDRLRDLFAGLAPTDLRRVDHAAGGVRVTGYAGLPAVGRATRAEQYLFVNGRPAGAPTLGAALREGYRTLLPRERYPVVFLFLELDPAGVDVNVHPTKREVRFRDAGAVRDAGAAALRQALAGPGAGTFVPRVAAGAGAPAPRFPPPALLAGLDAGGGPGRIPYPRREAPPDAGSPVGSAASGGTAAPRFPASFPAVGADPSAAAAPWRWCRILGQVGGLYVVMETEDGLALMDPHAAHERVLFERFLAQAARGDIPSQALLVPETVDLPPRAAHSLRRHLAALKALGFGVAEFGGDSFVVDALPQCFAGVAPRALLAALADSLDPADAPRGASRLLDETIARASCREAVKAHQALSLPEMEALVAQLARADMPYTCPHGRPTLIHISFQEWARKFGRE